MNTIEEHQRRCSPLVSANWMSASFAVATLISLFACAIAATPAAASRLDDAKKAWKARQERIRTASFEFASRSETPASSSIHPKELNRRNLIRRGKQLPASFNEPPRDMTREATYEIKLDGDKVRTSYSAAPIQFDGTLLVNEKGTTIETFDGVEERHFTTTTRISFNDQGIIRREAAPPTSSQDFYFPILHTYRAIGSALSQLDINQLIDTGRVEQLEGANCIVLADSEGPVKREYWIDRSRDFCLVRTLSRFDDGQPRRQIDIGYENTADYGPVVNNWMLTWFEPNGQISKVHEAQVTNYELNEPIPPEEFRFEFPVGTMVIDDLSRTRYIMRAGGQKREILPAERKAGLNYKQLRDSEPGELLPRLASTGKKWTVALAGGAVLVLFCLVLRKRKFPA